MLDNSVEKKDIKEPEGTEAKMPLLRNNFIVMIAAGVLIVLGFILMAGSPTTSTEYNPDIFSNRRIVIGPMLSFLGFVIMAVAIVVKPKRSL